MRLSVETAAKISAGFERLLASGALSEEDLFSTDYHPILDTNPQQYTAAHTEAAKTFVSPVIDAVLGSDAKMIICCPCDRNGYIAVHNSRCSQTQKPGHAVWNAANCRNLRIFDDKAGILAARAAEPIAQTYSRDMGGGEFVLLREVDAPILVRGRRWGGLRTAYSL